MAIARYGRYEVRRELGRGGTAVVYLAYDPAVGREVALKVLPSALPDDDQYRSRLRLEAKLVATLDHPHIVPIYDFGEEGDRPYLVMRYLSGGTLAQRFGGQPMPLSEFAPIVLRLAEALTAAHAQGIIHRDLKPSNVLLDHRGEPYLTDFGIAKIIQGALQNSLTGTAIVGTPAYMSPEQAMGERSIDQRADIYGLGVMTFEALTGSQPFQADTPMRVVLKHLQEPPPHLSPEQLEQLQLPPELNTVLQRALAKAPNDRFPTALDFALPLMTLAGLPDPDKTTAKFRSVLAAGNGALPAPVAGLTRSGSKAQSLTLHTPSPEGKRRSKGWLLSGLGFGVMGGAGVAVMAAAAWAISTMVISPTPTVTATTSATAPSGLALTATHQALRPDQTSPTPTYSLTPEATVTVPAPTETASPAPSATATETVPPTLTRAPRPTRPVIQPTPVPATATQPPPQPTSPPPQPTSPPPQPTSPPPQPTSPPPQPTSPPPQPTSPPPEPTPTPAPPDDGATPTAAPP